ncbi:MAG: hypothetical protein NDF54_07315 [archaeon GB-1867-035]|nr:hypothetical protein [Candidatus Culexmicrobium profundum]
MAMSTLKIIMRIEDDQTREKLARDLAFTKHEIDQVKRIIANLKTGQCIIKTPEIKPTLIQVTITPKIKNATSTKGKPAKHHQPKKKQKITITHQEIQQITRKLEPTTKPTQEYYQPTIKTINITNKTATTESQLLQLIDIPKTIRKMGKVKPNEPAYIKLKSFLINAALNQATPTQWKTLQKHSLAKWTKYGYNLTSLAWRILHTLQNECSNP